MNRRAFRMQLDVGQATEYRRRHDAIWPELSQLLRESGISNYSIFLDPDSHILFGVMDVADEDSGVNLGDHPVMRRWWVYMADIMQVNPDNSPVSLPLQEVFYLE